MGKLFLASRLQLEVVQLNLLFSSNPLTTILHPAILSYVQRGTLNVGKPGVTTPSISSTQLQTQIQFVDNAIITSNIINTATAPTISFTTNVFSQPKML